MVDRANHELPDAPIEERLRLTTWSVAVGVIALSVAVHFRTWAELWPLWENKNATYTHGSLIALSAVWFLWQARGPSAGQPLRPSLWLLPVTLVLSAAWLLAARANLQVVHTVLWPALTLAAVATAVGIRAARRFVLPLGILYFAVPIWDFLEPALQTLSANIVKLLLSFTGSPAFVDGPYIQLPDATIYIALTCSGAHFLSVSLALATIAGELRNDPLRSRLLLALIAAVLSIAFNSLRILLIVQAYLHPDLKAAMENVGHLTFGWWVFALDLLAFYLVLRCLPPATPTEPTAAVSSTSLAGQPRLSPSLGVGMVVGALILLPAASWSARAATDYPASAKPTLLTSIESQGPFAADPRWMPVYPGAAWEQREAYSSPSGRVIEVYRNLYLAQSQGQELFSNGAKLFPGDAFEVTSATPLGENAGPAPHDRTMMSVVLRHRSGQSWVAVYTYVIDEVVVSNATTAAFRTALRALIGKPAAGVVAVAAPCAENCPAVTTELARFARHTLDASLGDARIR